MRPGAYGWGAHVKRLRQSKRDALARIVYERKAALLQLAGIRARFGRHDADGEWLASRAIAGYLEARDTINDADRVLAMEVPS